jgi:Ca2+-binding EF-hand superfamily protein
MIMKTLVTLSSIIVLSLATQMSLAGERSGYGHGDDVSGNKAPKQQDVRGNKAQKQQAMIEKLMGQFDLNKDGQITRKEVKSQHEAQFGKMDADGNGLVSEAEFKQFAEQKSAKNSDGKSKQKVRQDKRMKSNFKRLDSNKDGQISVEEFTTTSVQMFKKFDANGDEVITKEELSKKRSRR